MNPASLLGIPIGEDWPSDIQYSARLLSSTDARSFFMGLNILVSIHAFNADTTKRGLAERILDALCRVLPSFIKKDPANDRYDINKTKMDASIAVGKHPLSLSQAIARPPSPSGENEDDGITVVAVEDIRGVESRLAGQVKLDIVSPSWEAAPEESPAPDATGMAWAPDEEEWIDAALARQVVEKDLMFDIGGDVSKLLEEGLNLINPVEREIPEEENVSSAGGYRDPYASTPPAAGPSHGPALKLVAVPAAAVAGQWCALGDGTIEDGDGTAFICPSCHVAFHDACASLVLEYQGATCPACNARVSR